MGVRFKVNFHKTLSLLVFTQKNKQWTWYGFITSYWRNIWEAQQTKHIIIVYYIVYIINFWSVVSLNEQNVDMKQVISSWLIRVQQETLWSLVNLLIDCRHCQRRINRRHLGWLGGLETYSICLHINSPFITFYEFNFTAKNKLMCGKGDMQKSNCDNPDFLIQSW